MKSVAGRVTMISVPSNLTSMSMTEGITKGKGVPAEADVACIWIECTIMPGKIHEQCLCILAHHKSEPCRIYLAYDAATVSPGKW